ncbi:beta-barrel assembly-enhancing protease [Desulfovulcanus sp.]
MNKRFVRYISLALIFIILLTSSSSQAFLGEFTIKDEAKLGQKFKKLIRARFPIIEDPEVKDYVQKIVRRIEKNMPPQPFPISIDVVNNNNMNAFATVAGYVVVFSGMIFGVDDESELAAVLAHELAHISQRHVAKNLERSQLIGLGALLGVLAGVFVGSKAASDALIVGSLAGAKSAFLKYSRDDEREADQVGLNFLMAAGFNPQGMVSAFEKIRKKKWLSGSNIPSYLSTHPGIEERIGYLQERIKRFKQSFKFSPSNNKGFYRVQTLLRARYTEPKTALAYFQKNKRDDCLSTLGEAIAFSRLNQIKAAENAFAKALKCAPRDSLFLREGGRFYYAFGKLDQAALYLQKAISLNPKDLIALFFYARVLSEKGDFDTASNYLQKVLKYLPEDAEVHEHLAVVLGQKGDIFAAHLHLAYANLYRNNKKQARFHLKKIKAMAKTEDQMKKVKDFEEAYKERSEFWDLLKAEGYRGLSKDDPAWFSLD